MIKIILQSGIAGLLALVVTVIITVAIILAACRSKHRIPFAVLALWALLPLAVGALGTAAGYAKVRSAAAELEVSDAIVDVGRREARGATYLGLSCTVFLWLLCGAAAVTKKSTEESFGGP